MRFVLALLLSVISGTFSAVAEVMVPFVGCPADGQGGPQAAPKGGSVLVPLAEKTASHLALYRSDYDHGVLAPRGWHCAVLYGSNGSILIVAPEELNPTTFLGSAGHALKGPAIQLTSRSGGTSGRFDVARLIARYFPERSKFLKSVIAEGIEPASDFPEGPFKTDRFITRQKNVVEYLTPPGTEGLGTQSRLMPADLPIHAMAAVVGREGEDWAGYQLSVRLPKTQDDLAPVILHWAEQTYASEK